MNIEQYNLDSLRKLVRDLQKENTALKAQLEKAGLSFNTEDVFAEKSLTTQNTIWIKAPE